MTITTSCDELDELTEFDVDTTLQQNVQVSVANGEFNETITINLADDPDIADNLDKIESVTINGAVYMVSSFTGDAETTGVVTVNAAGQAFGPFDHSFQQDLATQKSFFIGDSETLEPVRANLAANNMLTLTISGTASDDIDNLELSIELDVTVRVDAA